MQGVINQTGMDRRPKPGCQDAALLRDPVEEKWTVRDGWIRYLPLLSPFRFFIEVTVLREPVDFRARFADFTGL